MKKRRFALEKEKKIMGPLLQSTTQEHTRQQVENLKWALSLLRMQFGSAFTCLEINPERTCIRHTHFFNDKTQLLNYLANEYISHDFH